MDMRRTPFFFVLLVVAIASSVLEEIDDSSPFSVGTKK